MRELHINGKPVTQCNANELMFATMLPLVFDGDSETGTDPRIAVAIVTHLLAEHSISEPGALR